ncbi:MAG: hypothetical protein K8S99_04255 [Planctomycetes bacterium]|nr:hypothetical protein [Planctomycetota bacterium]
MGLKKHTTLRAAGLLVMLALLCGAGSGAKNLVTNGDFERGANKADEPVGWHTHITSYTSVPEYKDPANKQGRTGVVHFRCACGYEWGTVRPWAGLVCPQCKQMETGLGENAGYYAKNFESVSLVDHGRGKAAGVKMDGEVAGHQGVRVLSGLMKAQRGGGYEMGLEARATSGVLVRAFLEGFRYEEEDAAAKEFLKTLPPESNPYKLPGRIKRVFRIDINMQTPGEWTGVKEQGVPPKRSEFDYMLVNLYCYNFAGEAAFDSVYVRQLTQAEVEKFRKDHPTRDERFK